MVRMAIIRKSDGLIVNIVEHDPINSKDWEALFDFNTYDLIPAPHQQGYELGNKVDLTTKKAIDLNAQLGNLQSQLEQALSNNNQALAQTLKAQIQQINNMITQNLLDANNEFKNFMIGMQNRLNKK